MSELDYSLCAIDLDETLLGPDHLISVRNAKAIRSVEELGVKVVIASGRMHEATLKYAEQLKLSGPIISYNGALVKVPDTGEEWMHLRVGAAEAQEIMEFCHERGLQLNFYHNGLIYSEADTDWLQLYHGRTGSPYTIDANMLETLHGVEPTKLLIVNSEEYTNSLLPGFVERYSGTLYVTKTTNEYLEFMPVAANKGSALAMVADRYGVDRSKTIAIGDSYNDIPMVQWAGLGIAVGNAKQELQCVADSVVGRSDDDGVAGALEQLFNL